MNRNLALAVALLLALPAGLAACGDDDDTAVPTETTATDDGAPDEEALGEAGAFELEAFPPGETCNATYELEPGEYTLFCIVTAEDGETHLEKGMVGSLTVS